MRPTLLVVAVGLVALAACRTDGAAEPPGPTAAPPPTTSPVIATGLRQVHIATAGGAPVVNTEDYVDATVTVIAVDGHRELDGATEVRGRGNSTWELPKKPYRLKLDEAMPVAGMPAARNWDLLANYVDKSLVRNRVAMDLGEDLGLTYTPRSEFVDLYFSGSYDGVYELYEHIEIGPDRIDVDELDPDADAEAASITGGYHLEVDHRRDEDVCWDTSGSIPICSKGPEFDPDDIVDPTHPSHAQHQYITDHVNAAEAAIHTPGDSYEEFFDVDAMVDWYLVSELTKNNDSRIAPVTPGSTVVSSSVMIHKPRDGKLVFGPLWDFDISSGNTDHNGNDDPTGWWIRQSDWFQPLFEHSSFGQRVFTAWCAARADGMVADLGPPIQAISADIGPVAIERNFERWPILGTVVWQDAFVGATYDEELGYLTTWLTTRSEWMDAELGREFGECPIP